MELRKPPRSNLALQQTMQQMSEAHAGWRQSEADGTKALRDENETYRREWVEAKAALGREHERAADAKREAELQLSLAQEATASASTEAKRAREEVARLEGQLTTMKQLHETVQIQLREAQEQRASASALAGEGGAGTGTGGVAEELASARRTIVTLEQSVAAEKEHGMQYRRLAEAAEGERDEQLRLSVEVKSASEAAVAQATAAKQKAVDDKLACQRSEAARLEELEAVRAQLSEAQHKADAAGQTLREAQAAADASRVAHAADLEAMRVKLAAAEEEAERSAGKYRTELLHHSEDMQLLAAAKEGQADAIKAREVAETRLAEVSIDLETSKGSFEERSTLLS